jgi:hypothetical protein
MSSFNSKDQQMLQEAYQGILFENVLPTLTLEDVQNRLQYMSDSELELTEEVIEELFGGLKALGGVAGSALKRAGGAALNKAKSAYDKVDRFGTNVGKAIDNSVVGGAKQLGKNVSNIYKSGEEENKASKRLSRADSAIADLIQALEELQDANPDIAANLGDNFMKLPLQSIRSAIKRGHKSKAGTAGKMRKKGITGGVGDSIKQGWQSGFQG